MIVNWPEVTAARARWAGDAGLFNQAVTALDLALCQADVAVSLVAPPFILGVEPGHGSACGPVVRYIAVRATKLLSYELTELPVRAEVRILPTAQGVSRMSDLRVERVGRPGEALLRAGIVPVPAGEFFRERFLVPRGGSVAGIADAMRLEPSLLGDFLDNRVRVDRALADRLAAFTGTTSGFWLNLQAAADLAATWPEAGP